MITSEQKKVTEQQRKIVVVAGPTGSGKSRLAYDLASLVEGEVINADSRQLYKNVPLLTAQPDPLWRGKIPHHLYEILEVDQVYNVAQWYHCAADVAKYAMSREALPIFVGGTGLYIKTLRDGIAETPPISEEVKAHVRQTIAEKGLSALYEELRFRDPVLSIHPNDEQRIRRAMEVFLATGRSLKDLQKETPLKKLAEPLFIVQLNPPMEILKEQVRRRAELIWDEGLVQEIEGLIHHRKLAPGVQNAIGFREVVDFLKGHISRQDAKSQFLTKTFQYIKRQNTWNRHQLGAHMVVPAVYGPDRKDRILENIMEASALLGRKKI